MSVKPLSATQSSLFGRAVSSPEMRKFSFTPEEVLTADLGRFRAAWNVHAVKAIPEKNRLIGRIDFGISALLTAGNIPIDSPEFISFCRELRAASGSFQALVDLSLVDYPLVLCVSIPNVSFVRSSQGVSVTPSVSSLRVEVANDMEALSGFCVAAGLIDSPRAPLQYGGLRLRAAKTLWQS